MRGDNQRVVVIFAVIQTIIIIGLLLLLAIAFFR